MSRRALIVAAVVATMVLVAACSSDTTPVTDETSPVSSPSGVTAGSAVTGEMAFTAEVWADNWFALYINGVLVGEDSVPITTERSFNAERIGFRATYPFTIAMVTKDYKENDSGLEYIGTPRQQMGDGGFIAQVKEATSGRVVAATGPAWRGLVVQRAPLDKGCVSTAQPLVACRAENTAEPAGWQQPGFDDRTWSNAVTYTAQEVGTKDGYNTITWAPAAALIWSADLQIDNTILWRFTVRAA